MKLLWADEAWGDCLGWKKKDQRLLKRVNWLHQSIQQGPFRGIGKPEPLKYEWAGYWSRRSNEEHHMVYKVSAGKLFIAACRYHDKG